MNETLYRNKIKHLIEKVGGFVFRINDVAGTGLRYSDLIWIYYGNVVFIECKVIKNKKKEDVYSIKQGSVATAGQLVSNFIIQNAGALYVYFMHFLDSKETFVVFYEHTGKIYSPVEASELLPTAVVSLNDFLSVCADRMRDDTNSLNIFKKMFLNS